MAFFYFRYEKYVGLKALIDMTYRNYMLSTDCHLRPFDFYHGIPMLVKIVGQNKSLSEP